MVIASTGQLTSLDLAGNRVLAEGALAIACGIQKAAEAANDHRRDASGTTKSNVVRKDEQLQSHKKKWTQPTSLRVLDLQGNMIGHAGWCLALCISREWISFAVLQFIHFTARRIVALCAFRS